MFNWCFFIFSHKACSAPDSHIVMNSSTIFSVTKARSLGLILDASLSFILTQPTYHYVLRVLPLTQVLNLNTPLRPDRYCRSPGYCYLSLAFRDNIMTDPHTSISVILQFILPTAAKMISFINNTPPPLKTSNNFPNFLPWPTKTFICIFAKIY